MRQRGFAPVTSDGFIWSNHISCSAKDARRQCGEDMRWNSKGDTTWKDGWKRAKKRGIRIRRVVVMLESEA